MKKLLYLVILCCYFNAFGEHTGTIKVPAKPNELTFKAGNNKRIYQGNLGSKLTSQSYSDKRFESCSWDGMDFGVEPTISAVHGYKNPSLALNYQKHTAITHPDGSVKTTIFRYDEDDQTEVVLYFLSFPEQDVIKLRKSIKNTEQKEILLTNYASAMLHFNAVN